MNKNKQNNGKADTKKAKLRVALVEYPEGQVMLLRRWKNAESETREKAELFENECVAESALKHLKNRFNIQLTKHKFSSSAKNISWLSPSANIENMRMGGNALIKMLSACGESDSAQHQMLLLCSGILSSYYYRFLCENKLFPVQDVPKIICAPVIACKPGTAVRELIGDMMSSLALRTFRAEEWDEVEIPAFLPAVFGDRKTTDSAYCMLCRKEDNKSYWSFDTKVPVVYRDTAVAIDTHYFRSQDLNDFAKRNQWATIVQVGSKLQLVDSISIDFGKLSGFEKWDCNALNNLMQCFVSNEVIARKNNSETIKNALIKIDLKIKKNNLIPGSVKVMGLQRLWLSAQILVMERLATFMAQTSIWDSSTAIRAEATWLHLLLPSVYPKYGAELSPSYPHRINYEKSATRLFRQAVREIIRKYPDQIIPLQKKAPFSFERNGKAVVGYVRGFEVKTHKKEYIPCLQFREDTFAQFAATATGQNCDWYEVIKTVRRQGTIRLIGASCQRMPTSEEKQPLVPAIVIPIETIDWLPKAERCLLTNLIFSLL